MTARSSVVLPIDTSLRGLASETEWKMEMEGKGSSGPGMPEMTLLMKSSRSKKDRIRPLK
jgi:hypothetical protein